MITKRVFDTSDTPGEERHYESKVSCPRTQRYAPGQGSKPRPLNLVSVALAIIPHSVVMARVKFGENVLPRKRQIHKAYRGGLVC